MARPGGKALGMADKTLYVPLTSTPTTTSSFDLERLSADRAQRRQPHELHVSPSRWQTREFAIYYAIMSFTAFHVMRAGLRLSSYKHPNAWVFSRYIWRGWILGRGVDLADYQFRSFRQSVGLLVVFLVGYAAVSEAGSRLLKYLHRRDCRLDGMRTALRAALAVAFLTVIHGANALKIIALSLAGFAIACTFRGSILNPLLTWTLAMATLWLLEWHELAFARLGLPWLDAHLGLYPRWHVIFNISLLRMISFNLDYYFSKQQPSAALLLKRHEEGCDRCRSSDECCHKADVLRPAEEGEYRSFANYLAYVYYPPLYMAGPIMTFNAFRHQQHPPRPRNWRLIARSFANLLACMLCLELVLHAFWVVAIKEGRAFAGLSPLDLFAVAYLNLKVIWLKLLVIWRFFRAFALLDGIAAPENMLRCMSNNYSILGFWRQWHHSFNQWITRYMYVPLGGSRWALWNVWPIFAFVALWHDMNPNLLAWAFLVSAFIAPELLVSTLLAPRLRRSLSPTAYRHAKAVAAAANIALMMTANLVGFAVGVDGALLMLRQLTSLGGMAFVAGLSAAFFSAAQLMFEWRAAEQRRGIWHKF